MKRSQLKQILKPIVKEMVEDAVEEILLEEGYINNKLQEMILKGDLIKGVVSQVAGGITESLQVAPRQHTPQPVVESQSRMPSDAPVSAGELRRRMKQKMGIGGSNGASREVLKENPMISKIRNNEKLGKMFEGTAPLANDGRAILQDGTPNYKDPLSVSANIPDPELGGPVDENTLNALLGGKKFKF